jgi:SAM-dependent methyltransferase
MLLNRIKARLDEMLRKKLISLVRPDMLHDEIVDQGNELASRLRQEVVNRDNELANSLRQEVINRDNELASSLRREDELWAIMLRKEMDPLRKEIYQIGNETASSIFQTRLLFAREKWRNLPDLKPVPTLLKDVEDFSKYLEKFKNLYPHLYDVWASVNFGESINEYRERPESSCAVEGRFDAQLFAGFAAPYLQGRILDIGCGPHAMPNYLEGYPLECISGIDPLEPFEAHPFEFVQGFAEFLPWGDDSFDVVIAATSLDHVLSLDLAFSEIRRVLKPNGLLLFWDWFGDEYKPYRPEKQAPQLIDKYHLFNFSEKWFEELISGHFVIVEKAHYSGEWKHYYHYCLKMISRTNGV